MLKRCCSLILLFLLVLTITSAEGDLNKHDKPYAGTTVRISLNTPADAVRDAYNDWISDLKKQVLDETGIIVEVEMEAWRDYLNKHLMSIASGEGSDIIQMGSGVPPVIAATGGLVDLTEHMDLFGGYEVYVDAGHHYMTYDDQIIAIPWGGGGREMYYNKKIYDDANLEYPVEGWTYDDFLDDVKTLTEYMGQPAYVLPGSGNDSGNYFWSTIVTNGGEIVDEDGNVLFNNEIGVDAVRKVLDLYDNGYLRASFVESTMDDAVVAFINQEVALGYGTASWWMQIEDSPIGSNYGTVTHPVGTANLTVGVVTLSEFGIMKYTKNLDASLIVLSYLAGPESIIRANNILGWIPFRSDLMQDESFSQNAPSETFKKVVAESKMWLPQHAKVSMMQSTTTACLKKIYTDYINGYNMTDEEILSRLNGLAEEIANAIKN
ncbi:MAG: ABC transporter substrate-binding protein [Christensenellales bacterium]